MIVNKNGVQETKKANQQSKQGQNGLTNSAYSTNTNSPGSQAGKQLTAPQSIPGNVVSLDSKTPSFNQEF
ncbi:hypothetical protein CSC2_15920 [Clostridium zeae]|uniref:Uncharacterized protein n=1 Tax=Clostridium zeae TaxID=2759022 RepID=A0ABQ1E8F3_9CLOT|nr:hypothetical protein [Clostridium zeae]GFZ31066.1 hypothetical protein CSC2_15920 [Clostridium zeae]